MRAVDTARFRRCPVSGVPGAEDSLPLFDMSDTIASLATVLPFAARDAIGIDVVCRATPGKAFPVTSPALPREPLRAARTHAGARAVPARGSPPVPIAASRQRPLTAGHLRRGGRVGDLELLPRRGVVTPASEVDAPSDRAQRPDASGVRRGSTPGPRRAESCSPPRAARSPRTGAEFSM